MTHVVTIMSEVPNHNDSTYHGKLRDHTPQEEHPISSTWNPLLDPRIFLDDNLSRHSYDDIIITLYTI